MRKAETVRLRYIDSIEELKNLPPRAPMTKRQRENAVKNAMEVGKSLRAFYGDDLRGYYESRNLR